jgi:hypothetical protein
MKKIVSVVVVIALGLIAFPCSPAFAVKSDSEKAAELRAKGARVLKRYDDKMKSNPGRVTRTVKKLTKRQIRKATENALKDVKLTKAQENDARKEIERAFEEKIREDASPR